MPVRYIATQQIWDGEAINDVRHPRNIATRWTDEELAAIGLERFEPEPVAEPETDLLTVPLNPVQFEAMLGLTGKRDDIMIFVNALDEPQRSIALAKINRSTAYHRNDELFAQIAPAVGISDEQLDTYWLEALEIA